MFKELGYLKAIKKTSWVWFESKISIYVARLAFLTIHVYIVLLFNEIYRNGIGLYFVLSYGANIFSYVFFMIISFTYIIQEKKMKFMENYMQQHFQPFSSKGKNIERLIRKKMKLGKLVAYVQLVFTIFSLISLFPINSDRSGILYMIMIIKKANVSHAIKTVYCYANVMLYFVLHLHFQYILVMEDCRRLESGLHSMSSLDQEKSEYHRIIATRLASMINRYQVIDRYQILVQNLLRRPLFLVIWFGLIDFMFVSFLLLKVDLGPDIQLVFMVWLSIIEIAVHMMIYGQIHADQRENLWSILMDCQWFNWDTKNKRTYQMLLAHVHQKRMIRPGELMDFDLTFLVWFGRKTVSAVAFLSTIEEINGSK